MTTPLAARIAREYGTPCAVIDMDRVERNIARIQAAGKRIDAYFYDAPHSFFNDHRPEVYDKTSAELAWLRAVEFFRENLA